MTDLIDLARNQSICDATVVAGDTDVRVAVQIAQSFGVRVHLIGLEPSRVSQSPSLRQEVDTVHEISKDCVSRFLCVLTPALPQNQAIAILPVLPVGDQSFATAATSRKSAGEYIETNLDKLVEEAMERMILRLGPESTVGLSDALQRGNAVPGEYDRHLLGTCRALLGRDLTAEERQQMRAIFIQNLRKLKA